MTNLVLHRESSQAIVLPPPRGGAIGIRLAVAEGGGGGDDLAFIDDLQKKHNKSLGFATRGQLIKNIADGHVLIAEETGETGNGQWAMGNGGGNSPIAHSPLPIPRAPIAHSPLPIPRPIGYCIAKDRYKDHDDVGIVYQLAVAAEKQRGLIGATLIKAVFDRAAYGCKLFCCWCAQDLEANHFWESLGFVPLAFRTGSRKVRHKDGKMGPRIHIFWQRRIREGDNETAYWFPAETRGGAVKENRLVLPIPPGTHWSDAKPAILPGMERVNQLPAPAEEPKQRTKKEKAKASAPPARPKRGLWFAPPAPPPPTKEELAAAKKAAKIKAPREKFKNDPKYVEAARELRDRYIEQINAGLLLPPSACGKYDVSRQLEASRSSIESARLLNAA